MDFVVLADYVPKRTYFDGSLPVAPAPNTRDTFFDGGSGNGGGNKNSSSGSSSSSASAWSEVSTFGWQVYTAVIWAIGIVLSVIAVYLSWTCSTAQGQGIVMKVVLAIIAALFSVIYIIVHIILVFATRNMNGVSEWCSPASGPAGRTARNNSGSRSQP